MFRISVFLLLLLSVFLHHTDALRILFHGMHASSSHIGSMMPFASTLAKGNHYVHFLETDYRNKSFSYPKTIQSTYIRFTELDEKFTELMARVWTEFFTAVHFPLIWWIGEKALVEMYDKHYDQLADDILIKRWDLLVIDELFSTSSYALALRDERLFGTPYIIDATTVSQHLVSAYRSLGSSPIYRPAMMLRGDKPNVADRFWDRLDRVSESIVSVVGVAAVNRFVVGDGQKRIGVDDIYSHSRLMKNAVYYFKDDINELVWPEPTGNDYVFTGYHCFGTGKLDGDLATFVNDPASKGTIYMALGTNVQWIYAPQEVVDAFVQAFNKLSDYRVIFAFNGNITQQIRNTKPHIRVLSWAPQKEILAHAKTRLFITHGGLKSVKETLCAGVPALFMPFFAEQGHNLEMARQLGIGDGLLRTTVTEQEIFRKSITILDDPSYAHRVRKIASIYRDRMHDPLELGRFYTERAVNFKRKYDRLPYFVRRGVSLCWTDHFYLPQFALLALAVYTVSR